jgi:hypothetical protein
MLRPRDYAHRFRLVPSDSLTLVLWGSARSARCGCHSCRRR